MRLRTSFSIVIIAAVILYFGMVGYSQIHDVYSTEIAVTLYSEYKLKERVNHEEYGGEYTSLTVTDSDLAEHPVILELIQENLKKDIPKNEKSKIIINYEELKFIFESMASFYSEKYSGGAAYYTSINDERDEGGKYYYKLKEEYFRVDDQLYNLKDLYAIDDFNLIEFKVHTQEMNRWIKDFKIVDLTSEDLQKIPKLKEAIDEIGKYDMNVQSRKGMVESEFNEYRDWAKSLGLVDRTNHSIGNSFIEYDGKIYHIYFRDV